MLKRCGIKAEVARMFANTRKAYWRVAGSGIMQRAIIFSTQYDKVHVC